MSSEVEILRRVLTISRVSAKMAAEVFNTWTSFWSYFDCGSLGIDYCIEQRTSNKCSMIEAAKSIRQAAESWC